MIRAACMGIISYVVLLSGRQVNIWALLTVVLFAFALYNPMSLVYDISLQLSFLAVIGVILFFPLFERVFFFFPNFLAIKESIVMTLSATITTLPVMVINFGQFSLIAPVSNLLVGWTIPLAMLGGFITLMVSYLSVFLSQVLAYFTYLLLRFDNEVVGWL